MSLRDVVSGMGASIWQQIALVLFVLAFVAIVINVCRRSRADVQRQARLPLDDDAEGGTGNRGGPGGDA